MATVSAVAARDGIGPGPVGLRRYAWGVVGYNVLVILWGALVRATGSGAGCGNHWPLCNGQVIPLSPRVDTVIEFTHRCMTGGATFVVIGLVVWTLRGMVKGQAARVFAAISMGLLLNEALLGALLVKLGYVTGNQSAGRVVMLSIHLSNTLLLLGALTLTARMVATGQQWRELWGSGRRMGLVVLGLVATLEVGVSGSLAALGDTLFPATTLRGAFAQDFAAGSPWLLRLRWVHPASAVLAVVFVVWILQRARRQGVEWRWVAGLLGMQFLLGGADILLLAPTWMQIVHLLGADLYWISLVVVSAQALWPVETTAGATRSSLLPWREAEQAGPTVIVGPAS